MSKRDFYNILGVEKNVTEKELKKAYRKLALKWHPDKAKGNKDYAKKKFQDINDAYEVLNNPEKKKLYDQFGEEGLNIPAGGGFGQPGSNTFFFSSHGGMPGGFTNPEDIFKSFFGTNDPFEAENSFSNMGGGHSFHIPHNSHFQHMNNKPRIIKKYFSCTLEQLYNGCSKKMKITRKVPTMGNSLKKEEKIITINVRKGWKEGTKLTFPNSGDIHYYNGRGDDIQFILKETKHPRFNRINNDLETTVNITLKNALIGNEIIINTLDNRSLNISINQIISPDYRMKIDGEGMPISKKNGTYGNLFIKFKIIFPKTLNSDQKNYIIKALPN